MDDDKKRIAVMEALLREAQSTIRAWYGCSFPGVPPKVEAVERKITAFLAPAPAEWVLENTEAALSNERGSVAGMLRDYKAQAQARAADLANSSITASRIGGMRDALALCQRSGTSALAIMHAIEMAESMTQETKSKVASPDSVRISGPDFGTGRGAL